MENNGIPNVGNRNAIANGCGFQCLARQEHLQKKFAIDLVRQPEHFNHTAQSRRLVLARQPVKNPSRFHGIG